MMMRLSLTVAACVLTVAALARSETAPPAEFVNSLGMKMLPIPAGSFRMGEDKLGDWDEAPAHPVAISRPFFMGATEVTNAEYEQFDPDHKQVRGKLEFSKEDDEAVVFVSWHDAVRFCEWLSKKEGKPYRLPTEAEWEYACRAGTTTAYHTGDALRPAFMKNARMSWYPDPERKRDGDVVSLKVGQTPANAWGLQDMHGNVEEWCQDWYGPYEAGDATDPVGRADGDFRVTRGGSHSTDPQYLRSANRSGTLPEDRTWMIGLRVVMGERPSTKPLPVPEPPLNRLNVKQDVPADLAKGPDPEKPYFEGPIPFVKVPPGSNGPMFSSHNHDPGIVECPNGDLLAIWYSCRTEAGRELTILASRLRYGAQEWEPASPFWNAPDRNDHAPCLWHDGKGTIYHFNGLSAAATWGSLALVLRTSTDSGATWSKARFINPEHGLRNMPVESVFQTSDGAILLPCDAATGGKGGTAIYLSRDGGQTWEDPGAGRPQPNFAPWEKGAWIAGIHAGVVEVRGGRLLGLGRGNEIRGLMPASMSEDMGKTWSYGASPFPPIDSGQRLVLARLKEGPIFFASFTKRMALPDASGRQREVSGLYGALSFDDGHTWPVHKLITPGGEAKQYDGGAWTRKFTLDAGRAEPKGYLSFCQTPDGVIHLISSALHYRFNAAWLKEPMAALGGEKTP